MAVIMVVVMGVFNRLVGMFMCMLTHYRFGVGMVTIVMTVRGGMGHLLVNMSAVGRVTRHLPILQKL